MKLCAVLLVVALINWWLSVPTPEDAPRDKRQAEGSYAGDALIFLLCLAGVLYQRKKDREHDE